MKICTSPWFNGKQYSLFLFIVKKKNEKKLYIKINGSFLLHFFSTIEVTSKMESKVAQAIEAILLRVQMLQNGDSFADVVAEV